MTRIKSNPNDVAFWENVISPIPYWKFKSCKGRDWARVEVIEGRSLIIRHDHVALIQAAVRKARQEGKEAAQKAMENPTLKGEFP